MGDASASVVVTGVGLQAGFSVRLESGANCSPAGSDTGLDVSAGNSVNGGNTELTVSIGGAGVTPAGAYSVCVQLGTGDFVKVGATELSAVTRSLSGFAPAFIASASTVEEITISGTGLATTFTVELEAGATCTAAGGAGIVLTGAKTLNGDGTSLTVVTGVATVTAAGGPTYSVCVQQDSGDFVKVGASEVTAEVRGLTSFAPASGPENDASASFAITGTGLRAGDAVRLEVGGCTPAGAGTAATVVGVNGGNTQLDFVVGGAGLAAASYEVCVQFGGVGDFTAVPGGPLVLGACGVVWFFCFFSFPFFSFLCFVPSSGCGLSSLPFLFLVPSLCGFVPLVAASLFFVLNPRVVCGVLSVCDAQRRGALRRSALRA